MTDRIDTAQELQQLQIDVALANAKIKAPKLPTGRCNYCKVPCKYEFCDIDCKEDYEHEQLISARQNGMRQ